MFFIIGAYHCICIFIRPSCLRHHTLEMVAKASWELGKAVSDVARRWSCRKGSLFRFGELEVPLANRRDEGIASWLHVDE